MKRVGLILCFLLFLSKESSWACSPLDSYGNEIYFEKSVYKATITDRRIDVIDGPIKLSNCNPTNVQFQIESDESKYYPFFASYSLNSCYLVFFGLVRENATAEDTLYDVLTLNANVDGYVTQTSVIIIHSSEYDPYKLLYKVNGVEYVVLNYFYFKLFLLIILIIGISILVLELREIITKSKDKIYAQLDDHITI